MAGEKLLKGLEKFQIKSDSENKIFEKHIDKFQCIEYNII